MILSDEAVMIIIGLMIAAGVVMIAVVAFGLWLILRGKRLLGVAVIVALVGAMAGPGAFDRIVNIPARADLNARNTIPETLDLQGQRVLFIETGSLRCAEICSDVLGIGTDVEAHWIGLRSDLSETTGPQQHPLLPAMGDPASVVQVALEEARESDVSRYPKMVSRGYQPPFDTVIIYDDQGLLGGLAPELLGGALPSRVIQEHSILVFTDWPDPYATAPPAPDYRSVTGYLFQRPFLRVPFATRGIHVPSYVEITDRWARALCPFAGPEQARDAFTYRFFCGTSR